jgi:hypothetical protein
MRADTAKFVESDRAIAARTDVERMLKRIGCDEVQIIDDLDRCELRLSFRRNGTSVTFPVSAQTWTGIFLRLRPWTPDKRMTEHYYRENAVRQGLAAISPMLKTWIIGQVTAIENGLMPFEAAFRDGIEIDHSK